MKRRLLVLIILCYMILVGAAFFRPMVIKSIMDQGMLEKDFRLILILALLLLALSLVEEGTTILQAKLFVDLKNKVVLRLYTKVFQRLLYAKMEYFAHHNSTEIMNQLSIDINCVSILVDSGMMSILSYILQIVSGVVGLFVIDWKLAFIVLLIVPVKYLLICVFSKKKEEAVRQWMEGESYAWRGHCLHII